jgi:hypothetical protein
LAVFRHSRSVFHSFESEGEDRLLAIPASEKVIDGMFMFDSALPWHESIFLSFDL